MKTGNSKTSRFKTVVPLMIYMAPKEVAHLKAFAKSKRQAVSHVAREAISARLSGEQDQYLAGFNDGLTRAMALAHEAPGGKMAFPNGKTFADTVCESLKAHIKDEVEGTPRRPDLSPKNPWTND
jgi:hypothetical protein